MSNPHTTDQLAHGDVIVERFAGAPAGVKKLLGDFKAAHAAFAKSTAGAATAKATRDDALAAIGVADDALDAAVGDLADALVGAKMAPRKNAFAGFSAHPPSKVTLMAYASEVKEVLAICAKVKKQKPPADVAKAAAACEKLAGAVTKALASLSKPQLAYAGALAGRDALLPGWTKALTTLKRKTLAELDDAAAARALFAPPERVQDPKKKRPAKKPAAPPAPPVPPAGAAVPAAVPVKPAS
ncbi:MAG TPA: hypothetical protein VHS09_01145 [Polyangiaceae bacterium]|jgi:hypothetical protein|nr:hypothetical protein [Polyangiaceae bacterium]